MPTQDVYVYVTFVSTPYPPAFRDPCAGPATSRRLSVTSNSAPLTAHVYHVTKVRKHPSQPMP